MTNQTAILPERNRGANDVLRDVLEMLVPILLTLVIVALILFRVDVLHKFKEQTHRAGVTACEAVYQGDLNNWRVVNEEAGPHPTAQAARFLADYKQSIEDLHRSCLRKVG